MSHHIFFKKKLLKTNGTPAPDTPIEPEINYAEEYLTFEALENNFQITNINTSVTTYYRINNGSWVEWNAGTIITINNSQTVQFKAAASDMQWSPVVNDKNFNICGNIMSVIYGDSFISKTTFPSTTSIFSFTLQNSCVVNANNLILPVTTLTERCYESMFESCTLLETAPKLPATTLAKECYKYMFIDCTSLTITPELPATTLAERCYFGMFCGCVSLTTAQKISATILAPFCCYEMFYDCTSLTTAPDLLSTILVSHCYEYMFKNCEKLNRIKMLATNISAEYCLNDWVLYVAETGIFTKSSEAPEIIEGDDGIPIGWIIKTHPDANDKDYLKFEALNDVFINIEESGSDMTSNISYSYDKGTWIEWNYKNECIELLKGDYIYLKGNNPSGLNKSHITGYNQDENGDYVYDEINWPDGNKRFVITGKNGEDNGMVKASGNIMSLLYNDDFESDNAINGILPSYCFAGLFCGCASLITAPTLPAIYLSQYCYSSMFQGCTSLRIAPTLPSTALADWCYTLMFYDCTSLITSPTLPAIRLTEGCYRGMFTNCRNLRNAPALPATTLAKECYQSMFSGCTLLQTAPDLPATTLAPYCYSYMFHDCYNLNYIKIYADYDSSSREIYDNHCLWLWVSKWGNETTSGKFYKKQSTWISQGNQSTDSDYWCSGIPYGWTISYI